jgi:nucleobase transporter 1/2
MSEVKPEEISHPAMEQLQGFEYCIDSNPPWGELLINPTAFAFFQV